MITSGPQRIALAAKRLHSADRFDDRLRAGLRQVERSTAEGVVAICLDQAVRPRGSWLTVINKERVAPRVDWLMKEFIAPQLPLIRSRLSGKRAAGLLLSLSVPSHSQAEDYMGSGNNWQFLPGWQLEGSRQSAAAAIWEAVQGFD